MNRLENKAIIITGGNSGVGQAAALRFAQEGANVVICARREDKLNDVADLIKKEGGTALAVAGDISRPEDAKRVVSACIQKFGGVDVLINSAGIVSKTLSSIEKCLEDDELDQILAINTKGTFYMMREALSYMLPAKSGSIVNMASVAGTGGFGDARYVASKGAIISLTRHTAMMHTGDGIRCNAICPATIVTPMIAANMRGEGMDPAAIEAMMKHSDSTVPVNMPEDIASTLLFFASDESKNITGQAIVCDFGYSL